VVIWGSLSDKLGRRPVNVAGYIIIGTAIILFTTAKNVYPQLLLLRLFFAIGAAACSSMITALVGDCSGGARGKVSGVVGLFTGLGMPVNLFHAVDLRPNFYLINLDVIMQAL
jgi:MFS family permease